MKMKYHNHTYIKYIVIILIVSVAAILIYNKINSNKSDETTWKQVEHSDRVQDYKYDFDLILNTNDMTMDAKLDFTYYNNNEKEMNELVFYLYANSYSKEEYYAIAQSDTSYGYPNGFSTGAIDIRNVTIAGGGTYEVKGSQDHLLVITLDEDVKINGSTHISIEYVVTIPNSYGRFGYGDETISVVNCNPIMAVYDGEYLDYHYNSRGDPFYSECADYSARITVPKEYLVASTGTIISEKEKGDKKTYTIDAKNVRDFGFVASDKFKVISEEINGVLVNSYSFSSEYINKKALEAAVASIDIFSSTFGEYPYDTFNVVETNFYIGGMEYPGMVLIDDSYYNAADEGIMEMIIAHEAGHQWWYAQVGNDQVANPWLDEALTTFSERVYYEGRYPNNHEYMIEKYADSGYNMQAKYTSLESTRIDLSTLDYSDEYSLVVYGYGGWMFEDLREKLGEDVFYEALHHYLEDNLFEVATRDDLEKAIEDITGEDITSWFDENLQIQVG